MRAWIQGTEVDGGKHSGKVRRGLDVRCLGVGRRRKTVSRRNSLERPRGKGVLRVCQWNVGTRRGLSRRAPRFGGGVSTLMRRGGPARHARSREGRVRIQRSSGAGAAGARMGDFRGGSTDGWGGIRGRGRTGGGHDREGAKLRRTRQGGRFALRTSCLLPLILQGKISNVVGTRPQHKKNGLGTRSRLRHEHPDGGGGSIGGLNAPVLYARSSRFDGRRPLAWQL